MNPNATALTLEEFKQAIFDKVAITIFIILFM